MFKTGDKVVCVYVHGGLTKDKTYTLLEVRREVVFVIDDSGRYQGFDMTRFESVSVHRRRKIEKICSKLVR